MNYRIYYSNTTEFTSYLDYTSSTGSELVCDFNNYKPTYFKVVNTGSSNLAITNMTLEYGCKNNYPTLSVVSANNEMGTVSGGGVKTAGSSVTVNATAKSGYKFVGWYKESILVSNNASYTFTISNYDISLVAVFTYQSYTVTINNDSSKGTVTGAGLYNYLDSVTLAVTSITEGYEFAGWYEGYSGSSLISIENPYTFDMPYSSLIYTAKHNPIKYDVSLNINDVTMGTITGSGSYDYKSSITINATPYTGYSFIGWYSGTTLISSKPSYTFEMPLGGVSYQAVFGYANYQVTLNKNNETYGDVSGAGTYAYKSNVTIIATPSEGYSFVCWLNGDVVVSEQASYSFTMPYKSLTYTAKLAKNYELCIESVDESLGVVSAPSIAYEGQSITITANPILGGYAFAGWYDEFYDVVAYENPYTFIMPNNDVTLYADFQLGYQLTVTSENITLGTVSGGGTYCAGMNVLVIVNPVIDGTFKGWYEDDVKVSENLYYSFTMPNRDISLVAKFMTQEEYEQQQQQYNKEHGITPVISSDGKTLTYGMYPQTRVSDTSLVSKLETLTTTNSVGYYEYNNEFYAKMSATPYESSYSFDDGTTIVEGTTYWFKVEPIVWDILTSNDGNYFLNCSKLLINHRYAASSNNYSESELREYMNGDFYNQAFFLDDSLIQVTEVDNSVSTTKSSSNPYACDNTNDKVFSLSYQDYLNTSYGFSSSSSTYNAARQCKTTDYARACGAYYYTDSSYLYNGAYWTRSPYSSYSSGASHVDFGGYVNGGTDYVGYSRNCVRPAINIKIA